MAAHLRARTPSSRDNKATCTTHPPSPLQPVMPLDDLRSRKEAFVTGHAGTSWLEVHISCGLPILLLLLRQAPLTQRIFQYLKVPELLSDLACLIIPLIAAWTGLATPAIVAAGVAAALAAAHSIGPHATALAKHAPDRKSVTSKEDILRLVAMAVMIVIDLCYVAYLQLQCFQHIPICSLVPPPELPCPPTEALW